MDNIVPVRWWDTEEKLLLTGNERAEQIEIKLEEERQKAERLTAQVRAARIELEM
jgi:hypothetical protein